VRQARARTRTQCVARGPAYASGRMLLLAQAP
jgi:hypothetical protein